jgi:hypothetical protein
MPVSSEACAGPGPEIERLCLVVLTPAKVTNGTRIQKLQHAERIMTNFMIFILFIFYVDIALL